MLLKITLLTVSLFAMAAFPAASQHDKSNAFDEVFDPVPLTITIDKFDCFQRLQCLKRENPFKNSNLERIRFDNNRAGSYVVEGSSKNETLHAVYNGNGDLLKATVIQQNIPMPRAINEALFSGELQDWTMIGNELLIENFDKERMQYKVILQNEGEVRVEYFDRYGNFLNRLS